MLFLHSYNNLKEWRPRKWFWITSPIVSDCLRTEIVWLLRYALNDSNYRNQPLLQQGIPPQSCSFLSTVIKCTLTRCVFFHAFSRIPNLSFCHLHFHVLLSIIWNQKFVKNCKKRLIVNVVVKPANACLMSVSLLLFLDSGSKGTSDICSHVHMGKLSPLSHLPLLLYPL